MNDDDMAAALAGEGDDQPATADVERLRAVLSEPAVWVEPAPDLQQRVLEAIAAGPGPVAPDVAFLRRASHRLRNTMLLAAAALLVVVGVGIGVTRSRDPKPVQFAASLTATGLIPDAGGSVTLTQTRSGWWIRLNTTGLPRLDNGSFYQGWLKDSSGTLVPIGTFNEGTDVTLWSGVAPDRFPGITVTRQEAGAGPASSGQRVLVGTSHRKH